MNNKKIPLKILSVGDSFGEREFFTGENRSYEVKSKEFCTLLTVKRDDFLSIL